MTARQRTASRAEPASANESEWRRWNHPDWVAAWPRREVLTDAVSPFLIRAAHVRPGQRVCDVGSGGGTLSITLADAAAPGGGVVGLDLSGPLVALARLRADEHGCHNVRFVEMDVQTSEDEPGPFDVAVSQFGVMFFDEPTAALAAIHERLAPGGRFVFACWQGVERNPWHVSIVLRGLLPAPRTPPPGKSPVGPFAFGDEEYVCEILEAAGFGDVGTTAHEIAVRGPATAVVDPSLFPFMGVPAGRVDEAKALVARHLERFVVGPDEYEYPLAFTIYDAAV